MSHLLSKSTFVKGNQCKKSLYLNRFFKELRDEISSSQAAIFEQGTRVGMLARQLFPGGVDVSPVDPSEFPESVKRTMREIKKGATCIYEPAFLYDEVLAAIDILAKNKKGWVAYEVKSSTSVSDTYILDAALQYYLITSSGIRLQDICIVYINNQYVKDGPLDVRQLFTVQSVLNEVLAMQPAIPSKISELKTVLRSGQVPETDIGPHCSAPYDCDFMGHCWQHIPANSVFTLANLRGDKKWELYAQGVIGFDEIGSRAPDGLLGEKHLMQVEAELRQQTFINEKSIRGFISDLKFPLYFMDFETFQLAVPVFDGCRPYQQTVFQYSLHVMAEEGMDPAHFEFLADADGKDPRPGFAKRLIADCGRAGDILVYNIGFERGRLQSLVRDFPEFEKPLNKIIGRLKDLMLPFQQRWYYVPRMKGSYSIKQVLPALVPELSYSELAIGNGGDASNVYAAMVYGTFEGDKDQTRKDLLAYCRMDTLAMVKIYEKLREVAMRRRAVRGQASS